MSPATLAGLIGALAFSVVAQDRPGIDRPIRVGSFIGTSQGRYWNENTLHAHTALSAILANPDSAGLGPDLVIPPKGFTYAKFGVSRCETCPNTPRPEETDAFIRALDTLDVVYIGSFTELGGVISMSLQRDKLATFMTTKAYVGVNRVTDSHGSWPTLDSINGARFASFTQSGTRNATLRLDSVAENVPDWKYLNRGLFQNGLDTTISDQWFFWTSSGESIRAGNFLGTTLITVKILEETMVGGLGGNPAMGDHPMSWGRRMAAGGRVFYTSVGHRVEHYLGGPNNPRFLRRQIYNGILWTVKYDSLSQAAGVNTQRRDQGEAPAQYRIEVAPSMVKVVFPTGGNHTLELRGIDGRKVAFRQEKGNAEAGFFFDNLRPGVFALAISSRKGRTTRLVAVP